MKLQNCKKFIVLSISLIIANILIYDYSICQISTILPSDRLPTAGTIVWEEAGYPLTNLPIVTKFIDVTDYGATNNGLTDDYDYIWEAIQNRDMNSL